MNKFNLLYVLYMLVIYNSSAVVLDVFVIEEIKEFEKCPSGVYGPTTNITHTQDYESITICFRFLTSAYPHCGGQTNEPLIMPEYRKNGNYLDYRVYQPISGMSEDGRQAGWLGWTFNETSEGMDRQVPWRSILYKEPLKIYEWQSVCLSYSKKTRKMLMFHNGEQYLNYTVKEEHIRIPKDFLSHISIGRRLKGSFSDLQVYSKPMNEETLKQWTICQYEQPGDVYEWDINKFNLTHDERMISSIEKVDSKFFCKSKSSNSKELHLFGEGWGTGNPFSYYDGTSVCKRLNGKIALIPSDIPGIENFDAILRVHFEKCNVTKHQPERTSVWIGGLSVLGEKFGAEHWWPEPDGLFDLEDPDSGS